jgi:APA family basic amino acid/polyamine antiporter
MIVIGVMIAPGIFIVPAKMSPDWQLRLAVGAWTLTGLLTVSDALTYAELAAMMPQAGGMYICTSALGTC